jgi:AcrR family transcriptional regulator
MGIQDRRERERLERRASIHRAAIQVYQEEGYHGTTMEKIARKAELSRATLYLYFKTKDDIFVERIVDQSDFFGDLLQGIYNGRGTLDTGIMEALWDGFKAFYRSDPITFNVTLYFHQSEMIRHLPKDLRLRLDRSGSRNYDLLCKIIAFAIQKGILMSCHPKTLAEVVWTTFLGIIHLENSKEAMARKNHLDITFDLAQKILSRGTSTKGVEPV